MAQASYAPRKRKSVNSTIEPEQGPEQSISLIPPKKTKTTNFSKCVVCQQTGNLFKGKQASRNKFLNAARLRGDDVAKRIESNLSLVKNVMYTGTTVAMQHTQVVTTCNILFQRQICLRSLQMSAMELHKDQAGPHHNHLIQRNVSFVKRKPTKKYGI